MPSRRVVSAPKPPAAEAPPSSQPAQPAAQPGQPAVQPDQQQPIQSAAAPAAAVVLAAVATTRATLVPYYVEPHNAITQPDRYDWYLITRWLPKLGPLGFAIVKVLRRRCYHNRETGVLRNECQIEMGEIAEAVGVGRTTVFREFERNESLQLFVKRLEHYRVGADGARRAANIFQVSMDDPIHPEDMPRYAELVTVLEQEIAQPDGKRRTRDNRDTGDARDAGSKPSKPGHDSSSGHEFQNGTHAQDALADTSNGAGSHEFQNGTQGGAQDSAPVSHEFQSGTAETTSLPVQNGTAETTSLQSASGTAYVYSPSGGSLTKDSGTPLADMAALARPDAPSHKCDPPGGEGEETTDPEQDPETVAQELRASLLNAAWNAALTDMGKEIGAAARRMLLPNLHLEQFDEDAGEGVVRLTLRSQQDIAQKRLPALQEALSTRLARPVTLRLVWADKADMEAR